jgi:DDE superfamily endonuclease
VVVDNYKIHKAQAVQRWLAAHPRLELVFLPTYCPSGPSTFVCRVNGILFDTMWICLSGE